MLRLTALSLVLLALPARAFDPDALEKRRLTDHFNVVTLHKNNPPPARVERGAHLRDAFGRALYDGSPDQLVTIEGDERMVVQQRPVIKDLRGHRMFYLRGTVGTYHVGGKPTANRYSGFVWATAVEKSDLERLPAGEQHINVVGGAWHRRLKARRIGERVIAPVEVTGVHVGKKGTANHVLRMYGYAHGNHEDFVFGCTNLLGHVAGGGQVNLILPRGATVQATDIVHQVPDTREGPPLRFRLCTVRIGPPDDRVEVATWIATRCLAEPGAKLAAAPESSSLLGVSPK